jgi:hypothetical protein
VSSPEDDRWQPDEALVVTVRTRCLEMKELSGPDRSWIVASLTVQGWTVAAIADRLKCSLRLVQTIKTEPMTRVALYALELAAELANERALRHLDAASAAAQAAAQAATISRLSGQRDALLAQVQLLMKGQAHATDPIVLPSVRRPARRRSGAA